MSVSVDPLWLIAFLLAFVRAGAWLVVVPPFSSVQSIPRVALAGIAAGLALLAAGTIPQGSLPTTTAGLLGALVVQVVMGVVLGLPARVLLSAISSAGAMVDLFGGINLPPSLDPLSQEQTPLFGQLYEQVALVLLLSTNGEMLVVRGFEQSFASAHLAASTSTVGQVLVADMATFFTATLEIAAPIVAVLFATQIGLALLARVAPQMNVWLLGLPLQALLSLIFVAIAVRVLPGYLDALVSRALHDMAALWSGR